MARGVKSVVEIEDCIELLRLFQLFYYLNGRLPLTNGLLPIPDVETPNGSEKTSLKTLYEMFKDANSHGLVSVQFLSTLNLFFGGDVQLSKDTLTELYKILSFRTLSGEQEIEFDDISDLTAHIDSKMKHSILANMGDQDKATKTDSENVKHTYEFFKKPSDEDNFEREDILNEEPYEHKKIETPYVAPKVADAATIEDQTNKEIDDFLQLPSEFNKVEAAVTRQKKVDYYDKLFDDIQYKPDKRQKIDDGIKTKDIFIDDDLFSECNQKHLSILVDKIKSEIEVNDILFEHESIDVTPGTLPRPEPQLYFSNIMFKGNKNKRRTAKKITEEYLKMGRNRNKTRRSAQRAIQQLRNSNYLGTDDAETVNYND